MHHRASVTNHLIAQDATGFFCENSNEKPFNCTGCNNRFVDNSKEYYTQNASCCSTCDNNSNRAEKNSHC